MDSSDLTDPHKVIRPYTQSLPKETCVICRNTAKRTTRTQTVKLAQLNPSDMEVTVCKSCFNTHYEEVETRPGKYIKQTPKITEFVNIVYHFCNYATASTTLTTVTGDLELSDITYITTEDSTQTLKLQTYIETHSEQVDLLLTNTLTDEDVALIQDPDSTSALLIFIDSGVTLVIPDFTRSQKANTQHPEYCCFKHFKNYLKTLIPLTKYIQQNSEVFTIAKFSTQYRMEYLSATI